MSTPINDGGRAFPAHLAFSPEGAAHIADEYFADCEGMSLRDWFAGQALAASFAEVLKLIPSKVTAKQYAESLYGMADAMLEARNQKGTSA